MKKGVLAFLALASCVAISGCSHSQSQVNSTTCGSCCDCYDNNPRTPCGCHESCECKTGDDGCL